jgi:hypothetical protein
MTSLRETIARLLHPEQKKPDLPDAHFDYRVYWTKQAIGWSRERRMHVMAALRGLIDQPDFIPTESERLYDVDELGEENYAGASLIALETVLRALEHDQE